jgi:hypothetical protein
VPAERLEIVIVPAADEARLNEVGLAPFLVYCSEYVVFGVSPFSTIMPLLTVQLDGSVTLLPLITGSGFTLTTVLAETEEQFPWEEIAVTE